MSITPNMPDDVISVEPLVEVKAHNIALLFCNYLTTIGIYNQLKNLEDGYIILCAVDSFDTAKAEFEQFITQPYAKKYQQAAWDHGETVDLTAGDYSLVNQFKQNFLAQAGIVTLIVFSLCWLVFLLAELGWAKQTFNWLHFYPKLTVDVFVSDPTRLITPIFLHFSWLHIVFNTMWWWQLGGSIEKQLNKTTLINLLLISAIVSNIGQFLVSGANFGGLSGVVYALVGFVWWYGYLAPEKGLTISKPIVGFLLIWLVLGFMDLLPMNVANTAHLLGLLSGCFFAVVSHKLLQVKH